MNATETAEMTETREEILDTIEVCETYLKNAEEYTEKHGPSFLFKADAIEFAKAQVAFERAKLDEMPETRDPGDTVCP